MPSRFPAGRRSTRSISWPRRTSTSASPPWRSRSPISTCTTSSRGRSASPPSCAARGGAERLVWTTGAWPLWHALEVAEPALRRRIEDAVVAGDLVWHALPVTTHTELMDRGLAEAGLGISAELDERFGRRTIAAKMTDVPGHTRGLVPILAAAGVRLLHLGVNPAWPMPDVPPVFRWRAARRQRGRGRVPGGRLRRVPSRARMHRGARVRAHLRQPRSAVGRRRAREPCRAPRRGARGDGRGLDARRVHRGAARQRCGRRPPRGHGRDRRPVDLRCRHRSAEGGPVPLDPPGARRPA